MVEATDDFGDAPTPAQSEFAASYPTTIADNGARHTATGPRLGADRDAEADGQPTASRLQQLSPVDGDAVDEDGAYFLSSLVSATTSSIGYVVVNSVQRTRHGTGQRHGRFQRKSKHQRRQSQLHERRELWEWSAD